MLPFQLVCLCFHAGFPCSVLPSTSREGWEVWSRSGGSFELFLSPFTSQRLVVLCFQAMLTAAFLTWGTNIVLRWQSDAVKAVVVTLGSLCCSTGAVALAPCPSWHWVCHARLFSNIYAQTSLMKTFHPDRFDGSCQENREQIESSDLWPPLSSCARLPLGLRDGYSIHFVWSFQNNLGVSFWAFREPPFRTRLFQRPFCLVDWALLKTCLLIQCLERRSDF